MFPVFVTLFGFVFLAFLFVRYTTNPSTLSKDTIKKSAKESDTDGTSGY